jgi:hypothetical protein
VLLQTKRIVGVMTAGAALFCAFAWLRASLPPSLDQSLLVNVPASLAPWAVPGLIVGTLIPRVGILVGAALGFLTGAALALGQNETLDHWALRDVAVKGGWGILICGAAAWIGSLLRSKTSSNQRLERP